MKMRTVSQDSDPAGSSEMRGCEEKAITAEITAVYVLQLYQRTGIGGAIMQALARFLMSRGHMAIAVWVLRDNAVARRFYERLDGFPIAEKMEIRSDAVLDLIAYAWRDASMLAG